MVQFRGRHVAQFRRRQWPIQVDVVFLSWSITTIATPTLATPTLATPTPTPTAVVFEPVQRDFQGQVDVVKVHKSIIFVVVLLAAAAVAIPAAAPVFLPGTFGGTVVPSFQHGGQLMQWFARTVTEKSVCGCLCVCVLYVERGRERREEKISTQGIPVLQTTSNCAPRTANEASGKTSAYWSHHCPTHWHPVVLSNVDPNCF
jgi:hypothetical protein